MTSQLKRLSDWTQARATMRLAPYGLVYQQTLAFNQAMTKMYAATSAGTQVMTSFTGMDIENVYVWKTNPLDAYFRINIGEYPIFISGLEAAVLGGGGGLLLLLLLK